MHRGVSSANAVAVFKTLSSTWYRMIIAITGTPGTGKTTVAETLAEQRGMTYVSVNDLIEQEEVETEHDTERDATAVDPVSLREVMLQEIDDDSVLDGHLSHLYPADCIVVLRCQPDMLRDRLEERDWSDAKIEENIASERLDIVLQQASADQDTVIEIDTTDRTPAETVGCIEEWIEEKNNAYKPGHVNWKMPAPGETQ